MPPRKKLKIDKTKTIIVFSIIFIIAGLANWFDYSAKKAVAEATLREMGEIGSQMVISLEYSVEEAYDDLSVIAKNIERQQISDKEIIAYLNSQSQIEEFESLYYIDLEGNGLSINNEKVDFSNNPTFLETLGNKCSILPPFVSAREDEVVFGLAVPLLSNGKVRGALFGTSSFENFYKLTNKLTRGSGVIFIADYDLNIHYSSNPEYTTLKKAPDFLYNMLGAENLNTAIENAKHEKGGSFFYELDGEEKVLVYSPIAMTNWILTVGIASSVVNDTLANAVAHLNFICKVIYWIFIGLIIYTSYEQQKSIRLLEDTAYYDSLTGLVNLSKFKEDMVEELKKNPDKQYSVIMFDVEQFKVINEMYGFEMGNRVLKSIASFCDALTEPTLVSARITSDKFAMFALSGFFENMDELTNHYLELTKQLIPELKEHNFSFKIGRYKIELGETDVDDIINKVMMAHKKAKESNAVLLYDYDNAYKNKIVKDAEIINKMRAALLHNEYRLYLQPKFNVSGDYLIGAEALVRWIEADGTMIYPNEFIPLFEKNGFIMDLDKYVLEKTCIALKSWIDKGFGYLTVSVNLSRVNLNNPSIVDDIVKIVDKHQVPHELIEIELTESASAAQEDALEMLYAKLQEKGFKTSIDDFGAGYSSLSMLKNLNVNTLKMDRSFFVNTSASIRRDDMLIDGIVRLSHSLGLYVVAEGIETQEQVEMLKSMNCDAVQGYIYGKPLDVDEFEEKYRHMLPQKNKNEKDLELIKHISDPKFANSFVPCGIVITELDEHFTLVEANEAYFKILGYTREEVRALLKNQGKLTIHPDYRDKVYEYFATSAKEDPWGAFDYFCRIINKENEFKMVQLAGRMYKNEKNEEKLYLTVTDITTYSSTFDALQKELKFNSAIAMITDSIFFEYDIAKNSIRFSKNAVEMFKAPETIDGFSSSEIAKEIFPELMKFVGELSMPSVGSKTNKGEVAVNLADGTLSKFSFLCMTTFDESEQKFKKIGKILTV